jgi:hypothetical protein
MSNLNRNAVTGLPKGVTVELAQTQKHAQRARAEKRSRMVSKAARVTPKRPRP